jgi:hypothetical protein
MSKSRTTSESHSRPPVKTVATSVSSSKTGKETKPEIDFAFGRINYIFMIAGVILIILGFALMSGGRTSDPAIFNPEIFNTRRITIAPILVIAGFIVEVYAIVKKAED